MPSNRDLSSGSLRRNFVTTSIPFPFSQISVFYGLVSPTFAGVTLCDPLHLLRRGHALRSPPSSPQGSLFAIPPIFSAGVTLCDPLHQPRQGSHFAIPSIVSAEVTLCDPQPRQGSRFAIPHTHIVSSGDEAGWPGTTRRLIGQWLDPHASISALRLNSSVLVGQEASYQLYIYQIQKR
jgi:hypothetical protein